MSENTLKPIVRDENGLIKDFKYCYDENGLVDWKRLVPAKFLYINPARKDIVEKKYGKKIEELDVVADKIEDIDLILKLAALKYLLRLRGYTGVYYTIQESNPTYASVMCQIEFIANYETEGKFVSFGDCASATLENTAGFGQKYLVELASNRSFCRAIRNFLQINIVSQEELVPGVQTEVESSGQQENPRTALLRKTMTEHGITFEMLKQKLVSEKHPNAENFNSIEDIGGKTVFEIVERIKKRAAEKMAAVAKG